MSAGRFILVRYQANSGLIHPIRIQEETEIAGFNDSAAGAITSRLRVRASRSGRRRYGISARYITATWIEDPPNGYKPGASFTLPILTQAAYNAINETDTFTYLGEQARVTSKQDEKSK